MMMGFPHFPMKHVRLSLIAATIAFGTVTAHAEAASAVTRAEFVAHVVQTVFPHDAQTYDCMASLATTPRIQYTHLFADVRTTDAQATALCIGIHNGIIDGDRTAAFRPNESINVAEASKILALAYGVALPDSVEIRVLPWHWRYTEALKRRGVLGSDVDRYELRLTQMQVDQMIQHLSRAQPGLLPVSQTDRQPVLSEQRNRAAGRNLRTNVPANRRTV